MRSSRARPVRRRRTRHTIIRLGRARHPAAALVATGTRIAEPSQRVDPFSGSGDSHFQSRAGIRRCPLRHTKPMTRHDPQHLTAIESAGGSIRNLRRLDVRVGLIAHDHNRQLRSARVATILQDKLADDRPLRRRSLDGFTYEPRWLLASA